MLLQYIKTARKSFKCDIWQESLANERILTEDARCGDSTARYLLSIYWLLKSADIFYPPAVKSIGILYGEMLKLPSAERSYIFAAKNPDACVGDESRINKLKRIFFFTAPKKKGFFFV